jgi:thiosulfate/3-mercaptopyruvate sulfurtransferase
MNNGGNRSLATARGVASLLLVGFLSTSSAEDWKPSLMATDLLAGLIEEGQRVPYILYVGPKPLFDQGHITGSIYVGPGSLNEGMQELADKVKEIPRDAAIVVYCGCCEWSICPNLPPVDRKLAQMGFTNVKMLDIPTNLTMDWVNKNYPTTRR